MIHQTSDPAQRAWDVFERRARNMHPSQYFSEASLQELRQIEREFVELELERRAK